MANSIKHTVPPGTPPERLDRYLTRLLPDLSRTRIHRLIREGHVRLGQSPLKAAHPVRVGEALLIEPPEQPACDLVPASIPLTVLHEDDQLLVVDKPAGLVVHPAPGHPSGTLVNALLGRQTPLSSVAGPFKPGIVHRLDKDTSGLLVVAKTDAAHRALAGQFAAGEVKRVYLAVVQGRVEQDEGTIEAPIGRHPIRRQKMAVRYDSPRRALTRYRVRRRFQTATWLELFPQTGRTHQLRVHLKHLGHPLLGDARYGVQGGFPRQALHAHRLGLRHPGAGKWVEFESPLPTDLSCLIEQLPS